MTNKKKVGVLIVHGMGDPRRDFARKGIAGIRKALGTDARDVELAHCFWSPVLQKHQDTLWAGLRKSNVMSWRWFRRWILSSFGDPAAYLAGYFKPGHEVYSEVHACIRASLTRLEDSLDERWGKPLVILAHSLGSAIVTNYYWDAMRAAGDGRTGFGRMTTLTTLVTYGSNIPLFIPPPKSGEQTKCIQFPHPDLPPHLKDVARWINIYAPADVLGYPLAGIWDDMQETQIDDIPLRVGPFYAFWNPLSHFYYLENRKFHRRVAGEVRKILYAPLD